jgi:prevent-host-death family protein
MIKVTATKLRKDLFHYLDQALAGEIIVIQRNNKEVARLVAMPQQDWREKMKTQLRFLVPAEEIIQPIEDIWEDYV